MGQEQSYNRPKTVKTESVRQESVPYTTYSLNKSASNSSSKRERSKLEDIVIVSGGGNRRRQEEPDLKKLRELPFFYPLLRGSVTAPVPREVDMFERLDPKPSLKMCLRYEGHLRQCAEAVSFDQDMLSTRIREIEAYCTAVLRLVSKRHRDLTSAINQVKKVEEMSLTVKRINVNCKRLVPMMERLNSILPDEERLEHFSPHPHSIQ